MAIAKTYLKRRLVLTRPKGVRSLTWPVLAPSSTTADAATGDLIGTLSLGTFGFPRLAPSVTTTDAATGDVIGTLSV